MHACPHPSLRAFQQYQKQNKGGGGPHGFERVTPWSHPNKQCIHLSYNGAFTLDVKSVLNENPRWHPRGHAMLK
jgi:hypothetical protein